MKALSIIIIALFVCIACDDAPLSNLDKEDSRVYLSNYDKTADFKSYKTYYLPDTVFVIDNETIRHSVSQNSQTFLNSFEENLKLTGYVKTQKTAKPDLGIQISRISNAKIGKDAYFNSFFNTYWGYSNFGNTGFEYPGVYDQYEHGSTAWNIEVIDLKNANANGKLKILWNAQIWGLQILTETDYPFMVSQVFSVSSFLPKQ